MLTHLFAVQRDGASLEGFIQTINDKLSDIDMKLVQVNDPQTCHRGFGLVNTNPDEVAKIATPYSQTEISGLKRLVRINHKPELTNPNHLNLIHGNSLIDYSAWT